MAEENDFTLGYTLNDVEERIHDYCIKPIEPAQPKETKGMVELRKLLKDVITPEIEQIYGGRRRFLQRYLNARADNLKQSSELFHETLKIIEKYPLERELDEEEQEKYKTFLKFWPLTFSGFTKDGSVVIYTRLEHIQPNKFLEALNEEEIKKFFVFYGAENMRIQNFANSQLREKDEENHNHWKGTIEIFNMKNIGRKQVQVSSLRVLVRVLKLGQNLFPDTLRRSYIINVPWFFTAAWQVIKLGLNKRTQERVIISRGSCIKELTEEFGSEELAKIIINEDKGKKTLHLPKVDINTYTFQDFDKEKEINIEENGDDEKKVEIEAKEEIITTSNIEEKELV